jgi:hypothetical protein
MMTEWHGDNNYDFFTTMDNINDQLFQISLHGAHGISIIFQHKYNYISMHQFKFTILILAIYHHNIFFHQFGLNISLFMFLW